MASRSQTPPSLLHRMPVTKESNFWKRRCAKEEDALGACRSIELPWLEAAAARNPHVPGRASSLVPAEPLRVTRQSYVSHDKTVQRSGSPTRSPMRSPTRCSALSSPNVTMSRTVGSWGSRDDDFSRSKRNHAAELEQRIKEVETKLAAERVASDCARKALHAASYRSATTTASSVWHPKERHI